MTEVENLMARRGAVYDALGAFEGSYACKGAELRNSATLTAVKGLLKEIAAAAPQAEQDRTMSAAVVDKLRDAGIFRMMVPKRYGGDDLSPEQVCAVIEELATADGAAAWTAMVGVGFNVMLARCPRELADEVYGKDPNTQLRGAFAPMGKAKKVKGGYQLSGRWPFASGPYQPKWMVGGAVVIGDDGKPVMGAMGPETRTMVMPVEEVEFYDTWHTVGLRGTDSRDFSVDDIFVPDSRVGNIFDFAAPHVYDNPLFALPFPIMTAPTHSAVCLGITKACLKELATLALTKRSAFDPAAKPLGDSDIFQYRLAELSARYAALDSLQWVLLRGLDGFVDGSAKFVLPLHLTRNSTWVGYIHQETTKIVNEIIELASSSSVYTKSALQRHWRDLRIAAQHHGGSTATYAHYGAALSSPTKSPLN